MKVITRKILTTCGLETKKEFTHSLETTPMIALWNDNLICWYEKRKCTKHNEIRGKVLSCKRTFIIEKDGKKGVYSLDGVEIIPFDNYDYITEYCYALKVSKNDLVGAYSYAGKELLPISYPNLIIDKYGISSTIDGGIREGLYSYNREVVVPKEYKIQYIDKDIIICSTDDAEREDVYGMYSHDGQVLIPFEYDDIAQYNKCVIAEKDGKWGMLSNIGDVLIPFEYWDIDVIDEKEQDYFIVTKYPDYKKGLYKYNGKEILPPVYDEILDEQEFVITKKDGYYGLYTTSGLELLKPIYNNIHCDKKDIFIAKMSGTDSFHYIASLNMKIYANQVSCIGNDYVQQNEGVWTIIEKY